LADDVVRSSKHEAIERERNRIVRQLDRAEKSVEDAEHLLGVSKQWAADSDEYQATTEYIKNKKFICTAEEVQGLVVSRLMELEKVNLSGTGISSLRIICQSNIL
jgi:hypothetical protein